MAAPKQKKRTTTRKRRERENIERGQVPIPASVRYSIVTITDMSGDASAAMQFPGLAPAA